MSLLGCSKDSQNQFTKIEFNQDISDEIITTNLSGKESWGRWTDGSPTVFKFQNGLPKEFHLKLSIQYLFGSNKKFIVQVGEKSQSFDITQAMIIPGSVEFDFYDIPDNANTITILSPSPVSPKDLGISADERKLALGLASLEISEIKLSNEKK
jgi:phosphoglycerol transferase